MHSVEIFGDQNILTHFCKNFNEGGTPPKEKTSPTKQFIIVKLPKATAPKVF